MAESIPDGAKRGALGESTLFAREGARPPSASPAWPSPVDTSSRLALSESDRVFVWKGASLRSSSSAVPMAALGLASVDQSSVKVFPARPRATATELQLQSVPKELCVVKLGGSASPFRETLSRTLV